MRLRRILFLAFPPAAVQSVCVCLQTLGFEVFAMLVVIANAYALCIEAHDDSLQKRALLRQLNYVLTLLFLLELSMRYGESIFCSGNRLGSQYFHIVLLSPYFRWIAGGKVYWNQGINRAELLVLAGMKRPATAVVSMIRSRKIISVLSSFFFFFLNSIAIGYWRDIQRGIRPMESSLWAQSCAGSACASFRSLPYAVG
jgi:hypothetical protein